MALITEIIEERAMTRGRKKEIGPCRDGGQYRDISTGEIRMWNATKKPLGRPASIKTLATGLVHVAPAVELSPPDADKLRTRQSLQKKDGLETKRRRGA